MHIFYDPLVSNSLHQLNEDESKHCIRVLRMQQGDHLQITNGKGAFFEAEIIEPHPKKCRVRVIKEYKPAKTRNYFLHLAIAPTKNMSRFEWFVEKATEIGVDIITPLICDNAERKVIKTQRLEKITISAMKQSGTSYLTKIRPAVSLQNFLAEKPTPSEYFMAHCFQGNKTFIKNALSNTHNYTILIGPEGDFSKEEVEKCKALGITEISLGNKRLRTETAGVFACAAISLNYAE